MKRILPAAAVLCVGLLLGIGAALADDEKKAGPGDTVKALVKAMEEGDADKLKEIMPELGALGDDKIKAMAEQVKKEIEKEGGVESITIDKEEISEDGKTAKVTATLKNKNSEAETEEFELKKVKDKWVIELGLDDKGPKPDEPNDPDVPIRPIEPPKPDKA